MSDRGALRWLRFERGIRLDTARRARLGWNGRYFKIPVFSPERELWNVRTYDPAPREGRRKIWSVRGMGAARLYPISTMLKSVPGNAVIFGEGEWDQLLVLQAAYFGITRTDGAGKPWHDDWTHLFDGRRVFLCNDRDRAGQETNIIHGEALKDVADVSVIDLPFKLREKNGLDLTDFVLSIRGLRNRSLAIGRLMAEATPWNKYIPERI
jgi:hypothetical protein